MLSSILVGLDGSPQSASAVELAIEWARNSDALVVGLGVINEPSIRRPEPVPLGAGHFKQRRDDTLVGRERRHVDQILEQFALRCADAGVASKLLEDVGEPCAQIQTEAQRFDLILLGNQPFFRCANTGDAAGTLEGVVRNSPRPVVAVPERFGGGDSVLVAYDGSIQAARALQTFHLLGLGGGRDVHILSVGADKLEASRRAGRAVEYLRLHDIAATPHAVRSSGSVAPHILEHVQRLDAGLLIMGAYGHSSFREFLFGSVTRSVLQDSPVPVFLYH
jgi:nucleotide-binding universal stress UspA family protein